MDHHPYKITVIAGSTREGRFSDQAAAWVAGELQKRDTVAASVIDLRETALPFFDEAVSPSMKQQPYERPVVAAFTKMIADADAFVLVAPEYNHGPSAVLKNALDWVGPEWNNKPVAFVSYGSVGGARAVEQLRTNAIELQMAPIRNAVHIPGSEYFGMLFGGSPTKDQMFAHAQKQCDAMIDQLLWWTKALKAAREERES